MGAGNCLSLLRGRSRRNNLRQNRAAAAGRSRIRMHYLPRLRRRQAELASQSIDAARLRQLRLAQMQLAILFPQLLHGLR